ncbi:MAG TPA: NAD(P)/FAD-dependent oxidoreductase [Archangium sp.]|uniref:FAD-dependent oxidoreductase n=1 Tax=Archangium sp. TaxID=1872627 RepID=UPI002E32EA3E|nr:NAD(P)/FAD-dependent oxidoreductase [Archangium sp.]HEX5744890.1 NAD(P)/FAD-dependent oxidoreductase [Archangium sp.]
MSSSDEVIIVGGGPVGSVLALFLARRGLKVDVFDRDSGLRTDLSIRPTVNLTLCERGLRVLRTLGVEEQVREATVPLYGRAVHGRDGSTTFQPYGNSREALQCISRNKLYEMLLRCAQQQPGVTYHFGQRCLDVDLESNTLTFQDIQTGTTFQRRAQRIVGADGAFSIVRQRLQRSSRFDYSQQFFPHSYVELTVPLQPGGRPPFERNAIHFWPDGEVGLLGMPNFDGSLMLMLQLPAEGDDCSFESLRTPEDVRRLFEERFPQLVPLMPDLATEFFSRRPNPLVTIRCSPWYHQDKVVLVGDAAHALVPFYGQGINAGFEDCATLDQCLTTHEGAWGPAFRDYSRLRKPNLDLISDLALQHFWELRERVGDPSFHLRRKLERKVNSLYPDKYQSLYSMISFTPMSYVEAWKREQEHQALIEQLMRLEDIEQRWDGPEVEAAIHQMMGSRSR